MPARVASHEMFMKKALREALRSLGQTSPNPAVGAVLVRKNRIVARGHHRFAGAAHAEVECLRNFAQPVPADATLYVTLEPCSTVGRTPPCTAALRAAGLKKIVIGALDPNPKHAGIGVKYLKAGGIHVTVGVLAAECSRLNEGYNKWIQTGLPFVIAKCAMSLDGRLTRPPGETKKLTGKSARHHAHMMRAQVDAILVGAETLRKDNPRLTARGVSTRKQPLRVVVSRSGRLPRSSQAFRGKEGDNWIVYPGKKLMNVLRDLGRRNVLSVLIEGGGEILSQALDARLIDRVQIYLAPLCTGGVIAFAGSGAASTIQGIHLSSVSYLRLGEDLLVDGYTSPKRIE